MRLQLAVAGTGCIAAVAAAQHQFSIHDDLFAFPQFQVAFPETYILEADAQSRLESASSVSSAKGGTQTPVPDTADNAPSLRKEGGGSKRGEDAPDPQDLPQSYEYMKLDDITYLCSIPQVEVEQRNDTKSANDEAEEQKELDRARTRGSELIGGMDDNCLYYVSGWWSYSFCFNAEVKQFHQLPPGRGGVPFHPPIEDKRVPSYVLGQYVGPKHQKPKELGGHPATDVAEGEGQASGSQKATDLVQIQSNGGSKYLVQKLDDGTVCDLTGRPRRIEVQYHCNPQTKDRISWIKEISTCSYLMVVYTSRLCDDVAFSPPKENDAHQIVCREIVPEDKLEDWKARQNDRLLSELVGEGGLAGRGLEAVDGAAKAEKDAKAKSKNIVIGGVELGGMKTVGMPGKRLETPKALVAPAKDVASRVDVIAQYSPGENDGNYLIASDKDLEELGADPALVHEMAEEMYKLGSEKKWRIEIAQTPDGGELRGIIDDDGEEAQGKQDKQESEQDEAAGSEEEYYKDEL